MANFKKIVSLFAGIIGITLAIVWLSGGFEEKINGTQSPDHASKNQAVPDSVPVTSREVSTSETVSGTIASAKQITISSRILARIESVEVNSGDLVKKDDLLILLDARDVESQVLQARQSLQAAMSNQQLARVEHERNNKLHEKDAASQKAVDRSLAQLQVANAELERRKRELEEVETRRSYAEILAPVSGKVVDTFVESGDTAPPGAPLVRIYDPELLRVEVPVRESLAVKLKLGDSVRVEIPSLGLTTSADVEEIVPYSEPGARTLLIKLSLQKTDLELIEGMYVKAFIPAGSDKILTIPSSMIKRIGQLQYAYVQSNGTVSRRIITTGRVQMNDEVEVLSGLYEGENIIAPHNQ